MEYDRKRGSFIEKHPWFIPVLAIGSGFLFCVATVATVLVYDVMEAAVTEEMYEAVPGQVYQSIEQAFQESVVLSGSDVLQELVTWNVDDGTLDDPTYHDTQLFVELQQDTALHKTLYKMFRDLFAGEAADQVTAFVIATDGATGTFAQVSQDDRDPYAWTLAVDPLDAHIGDGVLDSEALVSTLAHEYAHLVTVLPSQLDLSMTIFDTVTQAQYEAAIIRERANCAGYMLNEGCATESAYLNQFYETFWTAPMMRESLRIRDLVGQDQDDALEAFYDLYYWDFLNDYAALNPEEDFAESFAAYVTGYDAAGPEVYLQKIRFFARFPEFVALKARIQAAEEE